MSDRLTKTKKNSNLIGFIQTLSQQKSTLTKLLSKVLKEFLTAIMTVRCNKASLKTQITKKSLISNKIFYSCHL